MFRLPGLVSEPYADRLGDLLSGMPGIRAFSLARDERRVTLVYDTLETHLNDVLGTLHGAGFEVPG